MMRSLLILVVLMVFGCDDVPPSIETSEAPRAANTAPEVKQAREIPPNEPGLAVTESRIYDFKVVHAPLRTPQGTLVLLHGYGSNPRDILEVGRFLQLDWEIWAIEAPIQLEEGRYAWFPLENDEDGKRKRGYDVEPVVARLDMLAKLVRTRAGERKPLVVAGFSQGGAVAMMLAEREDPEISGVAALSTWLPDGVVPDANREYFVSHGDRDKRVPLEEGKKLASKLTRDRTQFRIYEGMPHTINRAVISDLKTWILEDVGGRPEFN